MSSFIAETLTSAREKFESSPDEFVNKIGRHLGGCMQEYAQYFTSLKITSRDQLESLFKANFQDSKVQACFEELEEAEEEWNVFVKSVDSSLYTSGGQLKPVEEGKHVPQTLELVNFSEERILLKDLVPGEDQPYLHLVLLRHFA